MSILDSLPGRITGAIMAIIALLILLQQIDLVTGHLNGLYIQLAKADHCVLAGEPFDRVLISGDPTPGTSLVLGAALASNSRYSLAELEAQTLLLGTVSDMNNAGTPWPLLPRGGTAQMDTAGETNATWVYVKDDSSACQWDINNEEYAFTALTVTTGDSWHSAGPATVATKNAGYTPRQNSIGPGVILQGDQDAITWAGLSKKPANANNTSIIQTDGWVTRSSFLSKYSSISTLLANLFGLGIPIGLMLMMGSIGAIFVDRLVQGNTDAIDGRIGQIVVIIAMVIIATTVFGLITGGIQLAFNSIDPARFAMYDNVMGRVAATAVGFWGIMLVAGLLPIAFSLFRGRQNFLS